MEQSPRICLTSLALLWFVRIICIVACSCNVFIFIALQYFIVSVYFFFFFLSFLLLVNICWALFSFRLFKLVLLQTLVHVFRRTYICVLQIICLGVELLGFRLCIYSIRVDTTLIVSLYYLQMWNIYKVHHQAQRRNYPNTLGSQSELRA